ncbi:hypothetical protein CB1_000263007 [Camelus ferus]|nr:hypothetical protein CB1_000263007 [Camelus ferus]
MHDQRRLQSRLQEARQWTAAGDAPTRTMAPAMQPAETQLAERMASHGKGIRDQAVKKLLQYISRKMQRETGGFSQEELLKNIERALVLHVGAG